MQITEGDNWVIIRIKDPLNDTTAGWKVLVGWSGGYADGDSWKINSGIKDYADEGDHYLFHGYSGSTYKCVKDKEGIRMNIRDVVEQLAGTGLASVIDFDVFTKEWDKL
jgi:hypothetical protein